jgi:hypothetical protein
MLADGAVLMPSDLLPPRGAAVPPGTDVLWDARPGKAWGADLVLGLPSGVRVFHELSTPGSWAPDLEALAGFYIIFPTAGVGLRWQFSPLHGER